jgi:hypothetical protein
MAGLAEILADIHALEKALLELERKYGLPLRAKVLARIRQKTPLGPDLVRPFRRRIPNASTNY